MSIDRRMMNGYPYPTTEICLAMDKQTKLDLTQKIVRYQFHDLDILWEALQVKGSPVTRIGNRELVNGNRRLALVGDSVQKLKLRYSLDARGLSPG